MKRIRKQYTLVNTVLNEYKIKTIWKYKFNYFAIKFRQYSYYN